MTGGRGVYIVLGGVGGGVGWSREWCAGGVGGVRVCSHRAGHVDGVRAGVGHGYQPGRLPLLGHRVDCPFWEAGYPTWVKKRLQHLSFAYGHPLHYSIRLLAA